MVPTVGRIVHYRLSLDDVTLINQSRAAVEGYVGNLVFPGDVYPAVVVRVFDGHVNLQVLLDGKDAHWATSRSQGDGQGQWSWPPRQETEVAVGRLTVEATADGTAEAEATVNEE